MCDSDKCGTETTVQKSKDLLIKELGFTTSAFIGPACRPNPGIEDELSEFYKELKQIDCEDNDGGTEQDADEVEGRSKPHAPEDNWSPPAGRKMVRDHGRGYKPYDTPRSYGAPRLDSYGHTTWKHNSPHSLGWTGPRQHPLAQWQPPQPFGVPQGFPDPRFHFHTQPHHYTPPPPSRHPMYPPDWRAPMNRPGNANSGNWYSWETSQLPPSPPDSGNGGYRDFGHYGYSSQLPAYHSPPQVNHHDQRSTDWQQEQKQGSQQQGVHSSPCHYRSTSSLSLVLMRGAPGSGKSTRAKEVLSTGPNGLILSTDDYFYQEEGYLFDPTLLGKAHEWNQNSAREAMLGGRSPVVIDNTNIHAWEMKPYVVMALENGYQVHFVEPDTSWKCDPCQLEKKNKHGVLREKIAKMLEQFEQPMSVDIVLNSVKPAHKSNIHFPKHSRPQT